ncbi:YqjF family protein [Actinospongicola halichondriae]|uniref:YqjF family protein n=1 Tax=Actinospongicola halichondriae TaxID=3236844 RepID=UPI003D429BB8
MDSQALGTCPSPVGRAAMVHWWDQLTFLHWRYERDQVQRLLPEGLEVEECDGSAWVGLVPFYLRVGLPGIHPVPWLSEFAETNVRTYVRDAAGQRGIWFFSLDAARLGAVVVARSTYRLPYFWSRMRLEHDDNRLEYTCRRRWPGPRGARSSVVVETGDPFAADELTELDHFLTARWALHSAPRFGLRRAEASHDPWPLHRARVLHVNDELVAASGLPQPTVEPLVHYSESVKVRIGWPHSLDQP